MHELPYRTNTTWLTDDDLLLLDVMFQWSVLFRHLTRENYKLQWNLRYTHNYNDDQLRKRLNHLCEQHVLQQTPSDDGFRFRFSQQGGELWSKERCPDWDRYCTERYTDTSKNRTMMAVVAVSPEVRDDFLRLWPEYFLEVSHRQPTRERKFRIQNHRLISWLPFPQMHVGLLTYVEIHDDHEAQTTAKPKVRPWNDLERQRTWWRDISELQRFVPEDE